MTNRIATALAAALALAAGGCDSKPKVGTVVGLVTFDGQTVTAGQVCFLPADGKTYSADIDPMTGKYLVENVPVGDAAVIVNPPPGDTEAQHKSIKEGKGGAAPPPAKFPARYSNQDTSKLKHTVTAGESTYDIKMTK